MRSRRVDDEAGFTLVEMLVALVIVTMVAGGFLAVLISTVGASRTSEARTTANQVAQDYLEKVVQAPWSSIGLYATDSGYQSTANNGEPTVTLTTSPRPANVPSPLVTPPAINGVSYTVRTDITWQDDPSDGLGAADANGSTQDIKHVVVTVSWTQSGATRTVVLDDLRSPTAIEVAPSRGTVGLSVTVSAPSSASLDTSGKLVSALAVTATPSKTISGATLTYTTRTGTQTVAMTSGAGGTYTASLDSTTGAFDTGPTSLSVTVTAGSSTASGKATVNLLGPGNSTPTITVTAAPSQSLNATGTLTQAVALTVTTSSAASSGSVTYPTHGSSLNGTMSGSGTSWTYTVAKDSTIYDVGYETFSFTMTFPGGTTRTGFATISLYSSSLPPDVTNLVVNSPYTSGGTTQGFCDKSNAVITATTVTATVTNVASTDSVYLTAPDLTTQSFPMTYQQTNPDGSLVFYYTVPANTAMPNASSITLKAYALKTISGTQYRDDFVITVPIQNVSNKNSCT